MSNLSRLRRTCSGGPDPGWTFEPACALALSLVPVGLSRCYLLVAIDNFVSLGPACTASIFYRIKEEFL